MSENKHTPEPWAAYSDGKIEFGNTTDFIKSLSGDLVAYGHMSREDARRIVACVNACAGIPIEVLESGTYVSPKILQFQIGVLKKQRDELLAAAKLVLGDASLDEGFTALTEAVRNCEGEVK